MSSPADKPFRFKQFEVHQGKSSMRVGTDAVLLGAWVDLHQRKHILDVGTGTGVIALICAQRNQEALIEAIDIHEGSAEDAAFNFAQSPWRDRLRMHQGDFLKIVSGEKFDLIISNPPYFSHSLRATDPARSAARHDDYLPADAFALQAKKLLSPDGVLALILPSSKLEKWIEDLAGAGLHLRRICHVFTLAHKDASRVMIECAFNHNSEPVMESILIEKSPGEFSEAYKSLTRDYYTKW